MLRILKTAAVLSSLRAKMAMAHPTVKLAAWVKLTGTGTIPFTKNKAICV